MTREAEGTHKAPNSRHIIMMFAGNLKGADRLNSTSLRRQVLTELCNEHPSDVQVELIFFRMCFCC